MQPLFQPQRWRAQPATYSLSIGALFKNEAPYLKEWIEFHRLVGVEHFTLYDNGSADASCEILAPYIEQNIVALLHSPSAKGETNWLEAQRRAYRHCIETHRHLSQWLALIDIDEFLFPVEKPTLIDLLSPIPDHIGGLEVRWQLYGTSGLKAIPPGKLLTESLTYKAPPNYSAEPGPNNTRVKSIVRPGAVLSFDIHKGVYKPGCSPYRFEQIDQIRINHYWTRTENYFYEEKLARRLMLRPSARDAMIQKLADVNQIEDPILLRFLPTLKERLKK